jgi:hypothetical protein
MHGHACCCCPHAAGLGLSKAGAAKLHTADGGLSSSIAGAAALNSSSDGQAGVPLSTLGSNSGGKQKVIWGIRLPLRKDASWWVQACLGMGVAGTGVLSATCTVRYCTRTAAAMVRRVCRCHLWARPLVVYIRGYKAAAAALQPLYLLVLCCCPAGLP